MNGLRGDLVYAARVGRRMPVLTVGAIVILSLGIGVVTALYSVVRAVLLRPLPYAEPSRLIVVGVKNRTQASPGEYKYVLRGAEVAPIEELKDVFEGVAAFELWTTSPDARLSLVDIPFAEKVRSAFATPSFFDVLGVQAAIGRVFRKSDAPNDAVVISHGLWTRLFGGDAAVLGKTVRLGGVPRTIIGVLPRDVRFTYPETTEVWGLLRGNRYPPLAVSYHVIARLKSGVSVDQATAALASVAALPYPAGRGQDEVLVAQPVQEWVSGRAGPGLLLVGGAAALVFTIACANAGLLLLARTQRQCRDLAVRVAIGAGRGRILRQVATEVGVVGLAGTVGGVWLAFLLNPVFRLLVPRSVPRLDEIRVDPYVLAAAAVAGLLCSVGSGIVAYQATRSRGLTRSLREGGTMMTLGRQGQGWRRGLVVSQMMVVSALLVVAGLLMRSYVKAAQLDPGIDLNHIAVVQMRLDLARGDRTWKDKALRLSWALLSGMKRTPGVSAVAVSTTLPFFGFDERTWVPQGGPEPVAEQEMFVNARSVSPEFFQVFGIRLVDGRVFSDRDTPEAPRVVIVSTSLARSLFGAGRAVGRMLYWGVAHEIVGVVEDVSWLNPEVRPRPAFYMPFTQSPSSVISIVARTDSATALFADYARRVVRNVDPAQPVELVTTVDQLAADTRSERRFHALATLVFGVLALSLAAVGVFGSVEAAVSERTREIGIRLMLGAGPREVSLLIMLQGMLPVASGAVGGLLAALWLGRFVRTFLFEVSPLDPATLVGAPALLVVVAIAAAALPARWALRVDPATVARDG